MHERDARRVSAARPALRGRVARPPGGAADGGDPADRAAVSRVHTLPPADPGSALVLPLTSLQTEALQGVHGRLCGMVPGQAPQWMHVLWPALLAARRALGAAPPRALTALAQRLGVAAPDAAALVKPQAAAETPVAATQPGCRGPPLGP